MKILKQPEVKRDRYGRPVINGKTYTRASTLAGNTSDQSNLINWKAQRVAEGMRRSPELLDSDDAIRTIAEKAAIAGGADAGANAGTAVHQVVESLLKTGEVPEDTSDETLADARAVILTLDELGYQVLASEVFVELEEALTAGTADMLVFNPATDQAFIGDIKTTGSSATTACRYSSLKWATQLRAYAEAWPHNEDGVAVPWHELGLEPPVLHYGLVLHVERGTAKCTPIGVDLDPDVLALAVGVRDARSKRLAAPLTLL